MNYGLTDQDLGNIREAIAKFPEISQVLLFGSRAKGNYKVGSDVDLALKGESVTHSTVFQLADLLNETYPLPYFFDIINYNNIDEPKLVEHINRVGIPIFCQGTQQNSGDVTAN
jgi:predicted nucleotidyltransferase